MFHYRDSDIVARTVPIWGDWALHATIASDFAYRPLDLWFDYHPVYYNIPYAYPFVADLFSGILLRLGFNLVDAFIFPSIVTSFLLYMGLKRLYFAVLNTHATALGFFIYLVLLVFSTGDLTNKVLVPQRSILLGMTVLIFLVNFLHKQFSLSAPNLRKLFVLGLISGGMLAIHPHSILVIVLLCGLSSLYSRKYTASLLFMIGLGMSAFPLYRWLYINRVSDNFFGLLSPFFSKSVFTDGPWLLLVMLSVVCGWSVRMLRQPLVICGWVLIFLCGIVRFQPWDWDNTKLLIYAVTFLHIPISAFFSIIVRKDLRTVFVATPFLFLLTWSSMTHWYKDLQFSSVGYVLWDRKDIDLAKSFSAGTESGSLVLVSGMHNNPIANLSGRQILMGYDGWLWSYGINYSERKALVDRFYGCYGDSLLNAFKIDYVVFNKGQECSYQNLVLFTENQNYRIYRVLRRSDVQTN